MMLSAVFGDNQEDSSPGGLLVGSLVCALALSLLADPVVRSAGVFEIALGAAILLVLFACVRPLFAQGGPSLAGLGPVEMVMIALAVSFALAGVIGLAGGRSFFAVGRSVAPYAIAFVGLPLIFSRRFTINMRAVMAAVLVVGLVQACYQIVLFAMQGNTSVVQTLMGRITLIDARVTLPLAAAANGVALALIGRGRAATALAIAATTIFGLATLVTLTRTLVVVYGISVVIAVALWMLCALADRQWLRVTRNVLALAVACAAIAVISLTPPFQTILVAFEVRHAIETSQSEVHIANAGYRNVGSDQKADATVRSDLASDIPTGAANSATTMAPASSTKPLSQATGVLINETSAGETPVQKTPAQEALVQEYSVVLAEMERISELLAERVGEETAGQTLDGVKTTHDAMRAILRAHGIETLEDVAQAYADTGGEGTSAEILASIISQFSASVPGSDELGGGRISDEWQPALQTYRSGNMVSWLFGIGAGTPFFTGSGEPRTYIHNLPIYLLLYNGAVGLALYVLLQLGVAWGFVRRVQAKNDFTAFACVSMLAVLNGFALLFAVHKLVAFNLLMAVILIAYLRQEKFVS